MDIMQLLFRKKALKQNSGVHRRIDRDPRLWNPENEFTTQADFD
jgi:hypothetical protein